MSSLSVNHIGRSIQIQAERVDEILQLASGLTKRQQNKLVRVVARLREAAAGCRYLEESFPKQVVSFADDEQLDEHKFTLPHGVVEPDPSQYDLFDVF